MRLSAVGERVSAVLFLALPPGWLLLLLVVEGFLPPSMSSCIGELLVWAEGPVFELLLFELLLEGLAEALGLTVRWMLGAVPE